MEDNVDDQNETDIILQHLPDDRIEKLDSESHVLIHSASLKLTDITVEEQRPNPETTLAQPPSYEDYEAAHCGKNGSKFEGCNVEDLKGKLCDGTMINQS